jgi:uncharacterized protein (TIGR02246 family)
MKPIPPLLAALALATGLLRAQDDATPATAADTAAVPDTAPLAKAAKDFLDAFNKGDAAAIAALFLPNGELVLASGELVSGRDEIKEHYTAVFAEDKDTKAAIEASSVRFVTPGVAIQDGTVHLTANSGEVSSHDYTAVQLKQDDGSWLFASLRDQAQDRAQPSEKLAALQWLIGDWLIEVGDSRTWLAFQWSDDGPYLDARAVTEQAGREDIAATLRIGWDARRESFASWGFDAKGGFNFSEWSPAPDDAWLIHTRGITAEGELLQATQVLARDPGGAGFTWTKRDQVIGDEIQPDRTVQVVKRPPEPKSAETESK